MTSSFFDLCRAREHVVQSQFRCRHSEGKPQHWLMRRVTGLLILAGVWGAFWASHADAQNPDQPSSQAPAAEDSGSDSPRLKSGSLRQPRYEIRSGDVIDISFEFTPELNQTIAIQPDGFVTLREVGDIFVAGMTLPEVTDRIRTAYNKILNHPSIAVALKDFEKPYFIASGEVTRPGKYELRGDTTIVQAVAIAGGFVKESAKHSQVLLYRRVSQDWMEGRVVDVKKMLHDKDLSEDLHVKPGDMIIVPQNRISKVERFLPIPRSGINVNALP